MIHLTNLSVGYRPYVPFCGFLRVENHDPARAMHGVDRVAHPVKVNPENESIIFDETTPSL